MALREPTLSKRARRRFESSVATAQRGERMNRQLLTFARRRVLRPEVLNPNEVITNLETFIAGAVGENVRVSTRLDPSAWPGLADRIQFETALISLMVNALDAMDKAGEIVVETRNEQVGGGACRSSRPPTMSSWRFATTAPACRSRTTRLSSTSR